MIIVIMLFVGAGCLAALTGMDLVATLAAEAVIVQSAVLLSNRNGKPEAV